MNQDKDINEEKLSGQLQRLLTCREASGWAVVPKSNATGERLSQTELPRGTGFDQQLLRDLRTSQPDMETEAAST
jgi:hypothetical protein